MPHVLIAQLIADKTADRDEQTLFLKSTGRRLRGHALGKTDRGGAGSGGCEANVRLIPDTALDAGSWRGCVDSQRFLVEAPESPLLWIVLLDEVMAPTSSTWQHKQNGDVFH